MYYSTNGIICGKEQQVGDKSREVSKLLNFERGVTTLSLPLPSALGILLFSQAKGRLIFTRRNTLNQLLGCDVN